MSKNFYIVFSGLEIFKFHFGNAERWDDIPAFREFDLSKRREYFTGDIFKRFSPVNLPNKGEYLVDDLFMISSIIESKIGYEALFKDGQLIFLRQKEKSIAGVAQLRGATPL